MITLQAKASIKACQCGVAAYGIKPTCWIKRPSWQEGAAHKDIAKAMQV